MGRGDYLSASGLVGCAAVCDGMASIRMDPPLPLHAEPWGQAGGGELCLSLPVREHTMDSPVQTQKGQ